MGRRPHISQAAHALAVINRLPHTKGPFAEQPFNLRPWQVRIIKRCSRPGRTAAASTGRVCLMLPRKNGKTELAAALAVYFLMFDGEIGGEVYSAAVDRDQASLVFNVAAQMIRAEPELLAECDILDSYQAHRAPQERERLSGRSPRKRRTPTASTPRSSSTTSSTRRPRASSGTCSPRRRARARSRS